MHDELVKEDEPSRKIPWFPIIVAVLVGMIIVYGVAENRSQKRTLELAYRLYCGTNMGGLGRAMLVYAGDFGERLPMGGEWCDLLVKRVEVTGKSYVCKGTDAVLGQSCYAMNENVAGKKLSGLASDVVLLFETKPGWNQHGGAELLTFENHEGKYCNILFADLTVRKIEPSDVGQLKWKTDEQDISEAENEQ